MEDPVAAPSSSSTAPAAAAAARVPAAAAAAPAVTSAPPALAPPQPPATAAAACRRQLFTVELRPGETTIVSWKKLLKEAGHTAVAPPVKAEPAFAAHAGPSGAVSSHFAIIACWLVTCCIAIAVICALPSF